MATPEQQQQYQALSDAYSDMQNDLRETIEARQKLESQQQENKSVQKEFSGLEDDANIYKLVGPVLLKQDLMEAKSTVDGRLDYIENEIKRIEIKISGLEEKSEAKKMEIFQMQTSIQQPQAQATAS